MDSSRKPRASQYFILASQIAFAITIFLIPFRWRMELWHRSTLPVYADYTDFLLFASDIFMLYTLVFWACSLLLSPRRLKSGSVFIWLFLIGLTTSGWISVLGSEDYVLTRYVAVRFMILLFFYLYIVNEIVSPAWALVPVGFQILLQSIIAIGQTLRQSSLGFQVFGELSLDPAQLNSSVVIVNGTRFLRSYGLSDHPNILGGCLAFGLVLMLAVILYGKRPWTLLASILLLISLPALVSTFSRSAWLSFFVAGSFMVGAEAILRHWDSVKRAAILGLLSLLIAAPFIQSHLSVFAARVNSGNVFTDAPMRERAYLMRAGNSIFVEHSEIGVGLGASPLAMKRYFPRFPLNYQPPHDSLLVSGMETGVFGGAFYLLLILAPFLYLIINWKKYSSQPLILGSFALLLAITVVGFFDYYTWSNPAGRTWQWLAWGLWSSALVSQGTA